MVEKKGNEEILRVFVYGTLKKGGRLSRPVEHDRISAVDGIVNGSMFDVGGGCYPAVIFGGNDKVNGEVHEYRNAKEVLQTMDRIEGFSGEVKKRGEGNLYNRIEVDVEVNGKIVKCSTYEYNHNTDRMAQITNGVWEI